MYLLSHSLSLGLVFMEHLRWISKTVNWLMEKSSLANYMQNIKIKQVTLRRIQKDVGLISILVTHWLLLHSRKTGDDVGND